MKLQLFSIAILLSSIFYSCKKETPNFTIKGTITDNGFSIGLNEAKIDVQLMENLGSSMKNFQGAAEGLSAASESISSTNKYNEQVSMAAVQMETLNNLYKIQVENSSKQTELNSAVVENTERLKEQMDSLAKNLSSLNGVYGNMLSAMSSK